MQQALEALEFVRDTPASKDEIQRAWIVINLLQKRLARQEQESYQTVDSINAKTTMLFDDWQGGFPFKESK